jgi:hypothetical protein
MTVWIDPEISSILAPCWHGARGSSFQNLARWWHDASAMLARCQNDTSSMMARCPERYRLDDGSMMARCPERYRLDDGTMPEISTILERSPRTVSGAILARWSACQEIAGAMLAPFQNVVGSFWARCQNERFAFWHDMARCWHAAEKGSNIAVYSPNKHNGT